MNVHVIIGEDDFLIAETAEKVLGERKELDLEVIDSLNSTNADLQLADLRRVELSVQTAPFLSPRKVTWWKNVGFLPGGKVSEEVKTALEQFVERLSTLTLDSNHHFILSGPRMLKTSIVSKRLATFAEVVSFDTAKPWEQVRNAAQLSMRYADEFGLAFAPGVEDRFVAIVGTDSRSLKNELAKMRDYLGGERAVISAEDVAAVTSCGAKVEAEVWDVTDAIGRRNIAQALDAMRKFELENGFAVLMSGIIEKYFRQLIDVQEGRVELSGFQARKLSEALSKWSLTELKAARARFLDLREKVVSGTTAGDVLVVTTLVRVMRAARPRA